MKTITRKGKTITLLNPAEKGRKFATELKYGYAKTNTGKTKRTENGKGIKLTNTQLSYRAGCLDSRKDSANCYKAKRK